MLFLSGADVRRALDCESAMDAVAEALAIQETGRFEMPERLHMTCGDPKNILLLMPCAAEDALATKLVSVFPENRAIGRPVIDGLVVLNDRATGEILALMDGKTVTALRTGAVTGLSSRVLAEATAEVLGVVGCGVQAFDQVLHVCAARPIQRVLLHSRSQESRDALAQRLSEELPNVSVEAAGSLESLIADAQILVTVTTSRSPVLPNDPELFEGKHCVAVGSFEPTVREYPDAIFARTSKVWVDTLHALEESGELAIPIASGTLTRDRVQSLGSQIASGAPVERGEYGTTFFKSVGMALFDLQAARKIFENAQRMGLGTTLES